MKQRAGGWQQLSQTQVYENNWIRVTHEEVLRPNHTQGIYGVVHFKNQAVGVIPLDDQGHTWLVRQSRYTLDAFTWEIPEGGSPAGEDTLLTAQRELEEEVGIKAAHWEALLTMHTSNSVTDEQGVVYLARGISAGQQALEDSEDIEVKRLPLSEAIAMAMSGEITDAMSVCGLLKLALLNREK